MLRKDLLSILEAIDTHLVPLMIQYGHFTETGSVCTFTLFYAVTETKLFKYINTYQYNIPNIFFYFHSI